MAHVYTTAKQATKAIFKVYGLRKAGTAVFHNSILALFFKANESDTEMQGATLAKYYQEQGTPLADVLIFSGRKIYSFAEERTFTLASALKA